MIDLSLRMVPLGIERAVTDYTTFVKIIFHDKSIHWMTWDAWKDTGELMYRDKGLLIF